MGYVGDLVVGVWVGNDDNSAMHGVVGGGEPAIIWRQFMTAALGRAASPPPPLEGVPVEGEDPGLVVVDPEAPIGDPLTPPPEPPSAPTPAAAPVDPAAR